MYRERRFRCMTTSIELLLDARDDRAATAALNGVEDFFYSVEARFSRFLADSELSQLNGAAGEVVPVSPELALLVRMSLDAAERSNGTFNPAVLPALEVAGYDRSIDLIRQQDAVAPVRRAGTVRPSAAPWWQVHVSRLREGWAVERPAGVRLDLGGIAKGWAADRAASMLRPLGAGMVNAGGDLRAWGDQPGATEGEGWLVAVDNPVQPETDVAWLRVQDKGLATSSITARRWNGGHHLIDPSTGRPAETDLWAVSALAPSVASAEVAAKVTLILGLERGLAWLASQVGVEALLAGADGQFYGTAGIGSYVVSSEKG